MQFFLVLKNKADEVIEEHTIKHLHDCLEIIKTNNTQNNIDMMLFHVHTLGYCEYIYFIRIFTQSSDKTTYDTLAKSKLQEKFRKYYFPLLQQAMRLLK